MKKKAIISAVAGVIIVLVGIIVFLLVKGHFPADTKEKIYAQKRNRCNG